MGFLDRAKKLAEQAKELAEQATKKAEEAAADARARQATPGGPGPPPGGSGPPPGGSGPPSAGGAPASPGKPAAGGGVAFGTPYVPGMLGRAGWRERGLDDPAAVLPIEARDRVGVPRSTKSKIVEEPFGMGRRWSSGDRSAALFYQLHPDHKTWEPPGGKAPLPAVGHASTAKLADGRALVFLGDGKASVVLEAAGFDEAVIVELTQIVADHLTST